MHPVSCTNTHHDMADLENHRMVKNTKSWTSWERNITFLWSKKILNLCLKWRIFRSYCFVAEVTFNSQNVLSVIKVFCQFFLKGLLIYKKYLLTKSCKNIFSVSAMNCYCTYIFKGSNFRFSGVFFRTCFKNSYFGTSISNYL